MEEYEQQLLASLVQESVQKIVSQSIGSTSVGDGSVAGGAPNITIAVTLNFFAPITITGNAVGENVQNINQSPGSKQEQKITSNN